MTGPGDGGAGGLSSDAASSGPPGSALNAHALSRFGAQTAVHLQAAFQRSPHAMLIADDERRWVTANQPACDLLGIHVSAISWRTMDEVTPAVERTRLAEQWRSFLTGGAAEGWYQLDLAARGRVAVEFSAIANVLAGRHLMVFIAHDDAAIGQPDGRAARYPAWAAIAVEGSARAQLTKREREVLTLIAAGGHSHDIASDLFLSSETIKTHAQNAMTKLGAHTRAHAVAIALITGAIDWSRHGATPGAPPDDLRQST